MGRVAGAQDTAAADRDCAIERSLLDSFLDFRPSARRVRALDCSMDWNAELAYFVTPKSGPMRPMRTLIDANRALLDDLPFGSRCRPHWAAVARLLLIAAETGSTIDVRLATDSLVRALETEGWMNRVRPDGPPAPAVVPPAPVPRRRV